MELTIYLVGTDVDDACETFPFDSYESARSFADDNPGSNIYTVQANVDFTTIELHERAQ